MFHWREITNISLARCSTGEKNYFKAEWQLSHTLLEEEEEISPRLHSGSRAEGGDAHIKESAQGCLILKYPALHGLMSAPPIKKYVIISIHLFYNVHLYILKSSVVYVGNDFQPCQEGLVNSSASPCL